ncbi:MAG TPA: hypothetical protein VGB11_04940 [Candidatus Bathyarchaeia archaeon]
MRKIVSPVLLFMILATLLLIQSAYAYYNSEHDFSITPPTGWMVEEQTGVISVMFADYSSSSGATVVISVEETRLTLSEYTASAKLELNNTLDNWQLLSEGSRVIGGLDCYEIISTWNYSGLGMKTKHAIFVENEKAFVLSCASLKGEYVNSALEFENCLASFKIGEEASKTVDNNLIIIIVVVVVVIAIVAILMLRKKH